MGLAVLGVAVVSVSWAAILIRLAGAEPMAIAFWRLALATLLLLPVAAWRRAGGRQATGGSALDTPRAPRGAASHLLVLGAGTFLAAHFALWIASLFLTSVASSVMLVATMPVFTALLTRPVLGERTGARSWLAIVLSLSGVALITAGDLALSSAAVAGDLLALGAAAAGAVYLVLGRRARHGGPLPVYLLQVNGVATGLLLLLCWAGGTPLTGFSWTTWGVLLALAVGPHLAGHGLLNLAIRSLRAAAVNLALLGEPLLASLYAAILFREFPGRWFYAGAVFVVVGVAVEFAAPARRSL